MSRPEIPEGWRLIHLAEACEPSAPIMYGILQPGPDVAEGVPYVRPTEIDDDRIRLEDIKRTTPAIAEKYRRARLRPGDLLITIVGTLGKIAVVPPELDGANITQSSARIRVAPRIADAGFIRHVLRSYVAIRQYDAKRLGTGVPRLNIHHIRELEIPLPPLAEQRRIAAVLDKADALRAKRRQALATLDTLLQSVFLDMFGDPVTNPKGWAIKPLLSVCRRVTDGTHLPPAWAASGIPFLFVSNVVSGEIDFETKKFITEETHASLTARCPIERGDILYSTVGSYGCAVIVRTDRKFAFQRHIAHVKPAHDLIEAEYLLGFLQSPWGRLQIDRAVRGIAQKTLNLADLKRFNVALPPPLLQRKYVAIRRGVEKQRLAIVEGRRTFDHLFASLQSAAFAGTLFDGGAAKHAHRAVAALAS